MIHIFVLKRRKWLDFSFGVLGKSLIIAKHDLKWIILSVITDSKDATVVGSMDWWSFNF